MKEVGIRKARLTEHRIIAVRKSIESGRTVKDVFREAGISEVTCCNWKPR
ncbi:TPA: transposase [Klebsiella pneumoniae]|nr:transposase [Klebsiella pneumoniae]